MKHEQVVQQVIDRLQINESVPEFPILKAMTLLIVEAYCNERGVDELPDTEVYDFLSKINTGDLYKKFIEETQQKMVVTRFSSPELGALPIGEAIKLDSAINNLSNYLERLAVILYADDLKFIEESDFPRLGIEDVSLLKKIMDLCPLIEKNAGHYSLKQTWLIPHLYAQATYKDFSQGGSGVTRGADGKVYYPLPPQRKARPWDLPAVTQTPVTSGNSGPSSLGTHIPRETTHSNNVSNQGSPPIALQNTISKAEFESILNTYKSQSFLGYLSTCWLFSWISPTRSQTMMELKSLLSVTQGEVVQRNQIEEALNRGDNNAHRLGLFKESIEHLKNGTGTDEVIVQLNEAFKNKR